MCFSAPKAPVAAAPAATATPEDQGVVAARDRERRRQQMARAGSTNLTGGQGVLGGASIATKTLLGS